MSRSTEETTTNISTLQDSHLGRQFFAVPYLPEVMTTRKTITRDLLVQSARSEDDKKNRTKERELLQTPEWQLLQAAMNMVSVLFLTYACLFSLFGSLAA